MVLMKMWHEDGRDWARVRSSFWPWSKGHVLRRGEGLEEWKWFTRDGEVDSVMSLRISDALKASCGSRAGWEE